MSKGSRFIELTTTDFNSTHSKILVNIKMIEAIRPSVSGAYILLPNRTFSVQETLNEIKDLIGVIND